MVSTISWTPPSWPAMSMSEIKAGWVVDTLSGNFTAHAAMTIGTSTAAATCNRLGTGLARPGVAGWTVSAEVWGWGMVVGSDLMVGTGGR